MVLIVPLISEGGAPPEEIMGALIMASIFAYVFALPGAVLAGVIYGALKYRTATDSRWLLGGLAGGVGWAIYVLAGAALLGSVDDLSFVMLLPVGVISGALCARLLGWHTNDPKVR